MLNYQRIGNSDYSSFDLDYQRKNRVTVSIHPKFNGFGIIVVAPNLRVRVTPPYDKCECFLHCFPLISVTNERNRAISEKLHGSVYFQPIPSELGNPVRKQGKAGSMSAVMMNCEIKIILIMVFNSAARTLWSEGPI